MAGNANSGRKSTEEPGDLFRQGRRFEARRVARLVLADLREMDLREPETNETAA